MRQKQFKKIMK